MGSTLLRSTPLVRSAFRPARSLRTAHASLSIANASSWTKAHLPDLPYDYSALEPSISGTIMELHHKMHHQTYVTNYNSFSEQIVEAKSKGDIQKEIALQPLINFHGGGHINHSLFWTNLAPKGKGGGGEPKGELAKAIGATYKSFPDFISKFNAALASVQGSGWAWLVKDTETGQISIKTYANQDPVVGKFKPLLGIDAWEHAYYLDYQNRKAEYFKNVWEVVNWGAVEKRFTE